MVFVRLRIKTLWEIVPVILDSVICNLHVCGGRVNFIGFAWITPVFANQAIVYCSNCGAIAVVTSMQHSDALHLTIK